MPEVFFKGAGVVSAKAWIHRELGAATWAACLAAMPPSIATVYEQPLAFNWLPGEGLDAMFRTVAEQSGDRAKQDATLRAMGRYVAEDNLSTVYKMVLAVAKADHVFGLLPRLWLTYFKNIEVALMRGSGKSGTCIVHHAPISFLGPAASGWIEFAYSKVGCADARVTEEAFESGKVKSDQLRFLVRWS